MSIPNSSSAQGAFLTSLIEAERVPYGREDSFKLSHASVLDERFMLGVPTQGVDAHRVLRWCTVLGMPERFRTTLTEHLPEANLVFLGIEQGDDDCIFKVYLEFWDKVRRHVERTRRADPLLLHLGFKWRAGGDGEDGRVARYTCFPLLSVRDTLARIRTIYGERDDPTSLEVADSIVRQAAAANPHTLFLYAEVAEEGTPRKSFDINLYKADLTLADVRPHLDRLCRYFHIPAQRLMSLFANEGARPFGHVSGGVDRAGRDFMTLYYETRAIDP